MREDRDGDGEIKQKDGLWKEYDPSYIYPGPFRLTPSDDACHSMWYGNLVRPTYLALLYEPS